MAIAGASWKYVRTKTVHQPVSTCGPLATPTGYLGKGLLKLKLMLFSASRWEQTSFFQTASVCGLCVLGTVDS